MAGPGCAECQPAEPARTWSNRPRLAVVGTLIDEPHHILSVVSCRTCGQRFVSEFTEEVDWSGGDDPQSWALVPVTATEAATLLAPDADPTRFTIGDLPARRFLRVDHPREGPLVARWVGAAGEE